MGNDWRQVSLYFGQQRIWLEGWWCHQCCIQSRWSDRGCCILSRPTRVDVFLPRALWTVLFVYGMLKLVNSWKVWKITRIQFTPSLSREMAKVWCLAHWTRLLKYGIWDWTSLRWTQSLLFVKQPLLVIKWEYALILNVNLGFCFICCLLSRRKCSLWVERSVCAALGPNHITVSLNASWP